MENEAFIQLLKKPGGEPRGIAIVCDGKCGQSYGCDDRPTAPPEAIGLPQNSGQIFLPDVVLGSVPDDIEEKMCKLGKPKGPDTTGEGVSGYCLTICERSTIFKATDTPPPPTSFDTPFTACN